MISKRTHPMIGRLSELLVSGTGVVNHRTGFLDVTMTTTTTTSPRSPLEYRIQSPTRIGAVGLKNYDIGGVGLGIVAALEKSCNFIPKFAIPAASKSDPIPVLGAIETDPDSLEEEDYTYVTNHGPEKSFTKVYYDGGVSQRNQVSPALPPVRPPVAAVPLYSTPDFLSSCHLCVKKLHGKDIYMYREKAFCSNECRSRQIMNDERKEQCRSEVTRSGEVVSTSSPIFSTGILAI